MKLTIENLKKLEELQIIAELLEEKTQSLKERFPRKENEDGPAFLIGHYLRATQKNTKTALNEIKRANEVLTTDIRRQAAGQRPKI